MSFLDTLRAALEEVSEKSEVNIAEAIKSSDRVMKTVRPLADKHFHDALDSHSKVIAGVIDRPVYGYCSEWRGGSSYYVDKGVRGEAPMEHFDFKPLPKTLEEDMEEVGKRVGGMGLGEALRRVDFLTGGVKEMVGGGVGGEREGGGEGEGNNREGGVEANEDELLKSSDKDVKFPSMEEMRLSFGSVASATSAASVNTSSASRTSDDPMDFLNEQREKLAALQNLAEVSKMQSDLVNRVQESMKRIGRIEEGAVKDMMEEDIPRPPPPISEQEFRSSQEWIESRATNNMNANPRHPAPVPSEFYESIASEEYEDDFESFEEDKEPEDVEVPNWTDNLDVWASVNFASANANAKAGTPKQQSGQSRNQPPPKPLPKKSERAPLPKYSRRESVRDSIGSIGTSATRDSTTPEIAERILRMAKMRREKLGNMKKYNA
ncbi:hypothetical protein TrCOL_g6601 [Triparma columacea]|uniref:Uncharacterized protein n=2 Tax=Triparma columacea TaxID=722753 RepID=A0A9W7GN00_9STRA|nr:hypothetical protein TrCOL_g6601 [Triparma columacea]